MDVFGYSQDDARKILELVRRLDQDVRNPGLQRPGAAAFNAAITNPVRVSGAGVATGLGYTVYPGFTRSFNSATGAWADQAACYVLGANGNPLPLGSYDGILVGSYNSKAIYATAEDAGGPTANVVTNVCPSFGVISGTSVQTGTTVEYTPLTLPPGASLGTPFCVTNPLTCCQTCPCAAVPSRYTLTIAGVANGTSSICAGWNGTWTLSLVVGGCSWRGVFNANNQRPVLFYGSGGGGSFTLSFTDGFSVATYGLALASWSCLGPNTLTFQSADGGCTNWPATLTVTPAP
jgi:hypothetical protein